VRTRRKDLDWLFSILHERRVNPDNTIALDSRIHFLLVACCSQEVSGGWRALEALAHQADDFGLARDEQGALEFARVRRRRHLRWMSFLVGHEPADYRGGSVGFQPDFAGVHSADAIDQQFGGGLLRDDATTA
jgi:hypothetical protein